MTDMDRVEGLIGDVVEIKASVHTMERLLTAHVEAFIKKDDALERDMEGLRTRLNAFEVESAKDVARLTERIRTIYILGAAAVGIAVIIKAVLPIL